MHTRLRTTTCHLCVELFTQTLNKPDLAVVTCHCCLNVAPPGEFIVLGLGGRTVRQWKEGQAGAHFVLSHEFAGSAALLLHSKLPFHYYSILPDFVESFRFSPLAIHLSRDTVFRCFTVVPFLCRLGSGLKREFYGVGGLLENSWSDLCCCSRWRLQRGIEIGRASLLDISLFYMSSIMKILILKSYYH